MMFRCMTEGEGKKRGFVIDPNIHRVVETTLLEYGSLVKPDFHPKEATTYLLQERLINLNSDHWQPCFGHAPSQLATLTGSIYGIYSSRMSAALENLFRRMSLKQDFFNKNDYDVMKTIFNNLHLPKDSEKKLLAEVHREKLKEGIQKTSASTTEPLDTEKERGSVVPIDILRPISVVISLLTIHNNDKTTLEEMFSLVENNKKNKSILINQTRVWWGKGVSTDDVEVLVGIFLKYLEKDNETTTLIRQVKELISKNIKNSKELSKIIDKYLIPQENEKKKNAEVSTPYALRQDMLGDIPEEFWTEKRKVFEPCCGKGGFLMDIIDRFMTGLKDKIADERQRYKEIVETCLYFSDINDMNIFICRLLLDPYNEYSLNYNEGDTLKMDIKKKWGVEGFDAVIGNPPYNSSGSTGTGNTIWQLFVSKTLEEWTRNGEGRYIVLVHPSGWRKPNTEKGKFTGLYRKMVTDNYMRRLSIHGVKDGMKTFRCGTRYDWYIIEKVRSEGRKTRIRNEKGQDVDEVIGEVWDWFPNHSHEDVRRLLARADEERCSVLYSSNLYESRRKWISKIETGTHKYPCVHATSKTQRRLLYSTLNNKGFFGEPKYIFGRVGYMHGFLDMDGTFGMTEHAIGIPLLDPRDKDTINVFFKSAYFCNLMDACCWSNFMIDWRVFSYFRKDFYK